MRLFLLSLSVGLFVWASVNRASAQYHTYAQIQPELQEAATAYPDLAEVYDLGTSGQGRHLWAIHISDNVGAEEDEPEVRYISTMHGDEIIGVEMCLMLVDHLLSNYDPAPPVTQIDRIIEEVDLWIVPLMNPDGFDRSPRTRYNATGIDLNRNFPDPFSSPNNTTAGRAPETAAIMNWSFGRSLTLAANLHGGELVANYPFDNNPTGSSVYTACPDDDVFIYISEEYTRHNLPMWNSSSFFHGITNGADWYAIDGGMQDWGYRYLGCNAVTLELGTVKQPSASQIPSYWSDNRDSMLAYVETSLIGIRGVVTDEATGLPLAATVAVVARDHDVLTDPDVGDYHRMLLAGTYGLTVSAPGYDSLTHPGIVVSSGDATRWDVALGSPTVLNAPNGGEELHVGSSATISWTGNAGASYRVQFTANADNIFVQQDDFESGPLNGAFATGGNAVWSVTGSSAHGGSQAAGSGNIGDSQSSWLTRTVDATELSFWYRVSSEANWDFFRFSIDGVEKVAASGAGTWTYYSTTMSPGPHDLRWEFAKDGSVSSGSDMAWIDDFEMSANGTTWFDVGGLTPEGASSILWTPLATGLDYKVRSRVEYADGSYGAWDESDATFAVLPTVDIPAVSEWGLVAMLFLVLTAGTIVSHRRFGGDPEWRGGS